MEAHRPSSPYKEEWLMGPHETNFYTRAYLADRPIAVLVFIHGAAEHSGRYTEMHTKLSSQYRIAVFSYDLRGFGRTALDSNRSGCSSYGRTNWELQMDDLEWAIDVASSKVHDAPVFLMGTSMGGGQVLGLLCEKSRAESTAVQRVSGVIAGSPCITLARPVPKLVLWAADRVIDVNPYLLYPIRNKPKELSRNHETNASYTSDPFIKTPGSFRSLKDMISKGEAILTTGYASWPENIPLLLLHGTADTVTSSQSSEALYEKIHAKDKKLILYPNGLHELHDEPDGIKEKALADVAEFIQRHSFLG